MADLDYTAIAAIIRTTRYIVEFDGDNEVNEVEEVWMVPTEILVEELATYFERHDHKFDKTKFVQSATVTS